MRWLNEQGKRACKLRNTLLGGVVLGIMAGLTPGPIWAQGSTDAPVEARERGAGAGLPDELLVTARKREENVQDVPMSVSVIGGAQLDRIGANNTRDIGSLFPGVSFNDSNGSGGEFSIRGITSAGSGSDTSIGLYVDEVFVGEEAAMSQRLFDLQNIQILRGPQGTLFGRNTVAGAVNVITRKPEPEFGGNVEASFGNYGLVQFGGTLNVPLVGDKLMARVSYLDRERDGYLDNEFRPGETGNDENGYSLRAHLLARPTEDLDILLSFDDSNDQTCDNMFKVIGGALFAGNTDPNVSAWDGPCRSVRDIRGISLRVDQKFNDITFTSITAYRERDTTFLTDRDFTALPILITGANQDEEQFSQELRLAGTAGERFDWVVGAFYYKRNFLQDTILDLGPGFLGPGLRNIVNSLADTETKSIAVFATGEYQITEKLSAELGLRYTSEEKVLDYVQTATLPIPGFGLVAPFQRSTDGGEWSPTFTLSYEIDPANTVYARIARGFKSGGFNAGPSSDPDMIEFQPEFLNSYEIGYKSEFWDRRARFDGSVYYLDYSDIQQSDQDGAGFFISNAASARSYGVETQLVVRVFDNVNLSAGLGYVDAQFKEFGAKSGNDLPRAPKWNGSLSADISWDIGNGLSLFMVPTVTHRGANHIDTSNTELFKQPSHTLVDLRAGIESDAGWSIVAWGRNLTDDRFNLSGFAVAPILFATTISPPRTYGVDLRWNF